jgi:hypothetical protein
VYRNDLSYLSGSDAKRLTHEQWNEGEENVFMPGNNLLAGSMTTYAYLDFANYSSSTYQNTNGFELEIRPAVPAQYVAIAYLTKPNEVTTINDNVPFPQSMMNLIVDRSLNFIARKQGDNSTLYSVTEKDVARLVGLMT